MRKAGLRDWKGAVDPTFELVKKATPAAAVSLLVSADAFVLDAITHPYAQPALMFDGATTGMVVDRRCGTMIAPGGLAARAWLTRWGAGEFAGGVVQGTISIESTSSGGIPAGPNDVIDVPAQQFGAEGYGDVGGLINDAAVWLSGDDPSLQPVAAGPLNRRIELANSLLPTHEELRVQGAEGWGLMLVAQRQDLE